MLEFKHPRAKTISKKATMVSFLVVALALVVYLVFSKPTIERYVWQLSTAMQQEPYFAVIARHSDYDFSDDDTLPFYEAKHIDLTCVAEKGKLTITDKTNNKVYHGSYEWSIWDKMFNQSTHRGSRTIPIVIEDKEGTAQVSRVAGTWNKTLCILVDGYILNFDKQ